MVSVCAVLGDITSLSVDAIVNAANAGLRGGGGVDGAIHRAAGPTVMAECREIMRTREPLGPGEVVITGAGDLPCDHILHTVGPIWGHEPADVQDRQLADCYRKSLVLAAANGARSLAFPAISTGVYGFPKDRAAAVAVAAVRATLPDASGIAEVVFVCFGEEDLARISGRLEGSA